MEFALSTMYFQRWQDQSDLSPFFATGTKVGFDAFEMGHVLTSAALSSVKPGQARIVAVHHPCPNDNDKSLSALTSLSATSRSKAMEGFRCTLRTAQRLDANVIVLHLGVAQDDEAHSLRRAKFELESRYRSGQRDSDTYAEVLERTKNTLRELESRHLDAAIEPLDCIASEAADVGVRIGIETGYHANELPSPSGMQQLLASLRAPGVGAWLDTGHVGAQINLGLVDGFDVWFDAVGDRWCGAHLHDVVGLRDHLVPGTGELDFADILRRLRGLGTATCEVDWYFSPDELRRGLDYLRLRVTG